MINNNIQQRAGNPKLLDHEITWLLCVNCVQLPMFNSKRNTNLLSVWNCVFTVRENV